MGAVKDAIGTIGSALSNAEIDWGGIWDGIADAVSVAGDIIAGVCTAIGDAVVYVGGIVGTAFLAVGDQLGWLVEQAQTDGTAINAAWTAVQDAFSAVSDVIGMALEVYPLYSAHSSRIISLAQVCFLPYGSMRQHILQRLRRPLPMRYRASRTRSNGLWTKRRRTARSSMRSGRRCKRCSRR